MARLTLDGFRSDMQWLLGRSSSRNITPTPASPSSPVQAPAQPVKNMQHPFTVLGPEYTKLLSQMKVTRASEIDAVAQKLLRAPIINQHIEVSKITHVPAIWYAAVFEREASSNFHLALGQGDPWNQVSTHVPRNQGPFKSWIDAAVFYSNYDHLIEAPYPWDIAYALYRGEQWNGYGPRNHGRYTGYLWSGTDVYDPPKGLGGKYVDDGKWSSGTIDKQLGIVPVMLRMVQLRPDLALPGMPGAITASASWTPPVVVEGTGSGTPDTAWIQHAINELGYSPPLDEDGNYGKLTRYAVMAFQRTNNLTVDGFAGTNTKAALQKALAEELGTG